MDITRTTKRQTARLEPSHINGSLADVIQTLQQVLASIPEPYRGSAAVEVVGYDDFGDSDVAVEVSFERPETDAEFEQRKAQIEARERHQTANEQAHFKRLAAKLGYVDRLHEGRTDD